MYFPHFIYRFYILTYLIMVIGTVGYNWLGTIIYSKSKGYLIIGAREVIFFNLKKLIETIGKISLLYWKMANSRIYIYRKWAENPDLLYFPNRYFPNRYAPNRYFPNSHIAVKQWVMTLKWYWKTKNLLFRFCENWPFFIIW